jgi:hypothetical protein
MTTEDEEDPGGYDERGETYHHDSVSDRIQFIKESPGYRTRRTVFRSVGVDIDKVETERKLYALDRLHRDLFFEVVTARIMSRPSTNLENEILKATVLSEYEKANAIARRLRRRRTLGLRPVPHRD